MLVQEAFLYLGFEQVSGLLFISMSARSLLNCIRRRKCVACPCLHACVRVKPHVLRISSQVRLGHKY